VSNLKKLIATAMLIALSVVLPLAFHSVPQFGIILLPMHIPVLLAGLICGWKYGFAAGAVAPALSSAITGMPPAGIVPAMTIELAVYGFVAGLVLEFVRTKRASFDLYIALVTAILAGRVVAGVANFIYFSVGEYSLAAWTSLYFTTALPGLVIQLAFIPSVVMALERERVIPPRYKV
jgi:riboflavin transporter FmnP